MRTGPPPDRIDLWLVKVFEQSREAARGFLTTEELSRSDRFHHPADRHRYEVTRACLRRLLGRALQRDADAIDIRAGRGGKPELGAGATYLWFNCSHSGDWALIGLSRHGPIGVDIEQVAPRGDLEGLIAISFAPSEISRLKAFDGEAKWSEFYRYWTLKEALLKAMGSGLVRDPKSIEVDPTRAGDNALAAIDGVPKTGGGWSVMSLPLEEQGLRAAVAFRGAPEVRLSRWDADARAGAQSVRSVST